MSMSYRTIKSARRATLCLAGASVIAMTMAQSAIAQTSDPEDEVVAIGTRQVIQDAIKLKRNATTVVDGLSADEIDACLLYTSPSPRDS